MVIRPKRLVVLNVGYTDCRGPACATRGSGARKKWPELTAGLPCKNGAFLSGVLIPGVAGPSQPAHPQVQKAPGLGGVSPAQLAVESPEPRRALLFGRAIPAGARAWGSATLPPRHPWGSLENFAGVAEDGVDASGLSCVWNEQSGDAAHRRWLFSPKSAEGAMLVHPWEKRGQLWSQTAQ